MESAEPTTNTMDGTASFQAQGSHSAFSFASIPAQLFNNIQSAAGASTAPQPSPWSWFGAVKQQENSAPDASASLRHLSLSKHLADAISHLQLKDRASSNQSASTSAPGSSHQATSKPVQLSFLKKTPKLLGRQVLKGRHVLPLSGDEPVYDDRDARWWEYKEDAEHGSYAYALQDFWGRRYEDALPGSRGQELLPEHERGQPVLTCRDFVKRVLSDNQGHVHCVKAEEPCPAGHYKIMSFINAQSAEAAGGDDSEDVDFLDYHFYMQHKDAWITLQEGDRVLDLAHFLKMPVDHIYASNPGLGAIPPDRPLDAQRSVYVPDANVWSHKPSELQSPRMHDGSGEVIRDPRRALPACSDDEESEEGVMCELPSTYCCSFCVQKGKVKAGAKPWQAIDTRQEND